MKNNFKRIGLAACIAISPIMGFADILAAWDVDGVDVADGTGVDNASFPHTKNATTLAANVSGGELTLGFSAPSGAADMYGFKFEDGSHQTSLAEAILLNHFIQFTVVSAPGYRFDLASIKMLGTSRENGPDDIAILSDVDGFIDGTEIRTLTGCQSSSAGTWDTDPSGWGGLIDLTMSQYQDLGSVTFRIYGWNSTGSESAGIRSLTGNDLVINGTIEAIPEPAAAGLIGLTGLGLLVARRFFARD